MAKDCTSTALYESLKYCQGKPVLPGIRQKVYVIPKRDIVKWPKLPETAAAGMGELATYVGSFELAAEKSFLSLDLVLNKGMVEWETQGDKPWRTFLNKVTLHHAEVDEAATAYARQVLTDDMVYVVNQRDGKWRVLGNEMFETDTKPKGSTGEGASGESGTQFEVEVTDVCPAPFYVGTLTTEDGEIDCSGAAVEGDNA